MARASGATQMSFLRLFDLYPISSSENGIEVGVLVEILLTAEVAYFLFDSLIEKQHKIINAAVRFLFVIFERFFIFNVISFLIIEGRFDAVFKVVEISLSQRIHDAESSRIPINADVVLLLQILLLIFEQLNDAAALLTFSSFSLSSSMRFFSFSAAAAAAAGSWAAAAAALRMY
uniref:Uncharacterized protein n=1 Tax=Pristionchus pacificus TaxID=54126 RepID=A0A2A6B593_PRIPA|eukprot:PDM61044.1 hypothetical protein PRIPAC_54850 [Pristionchus pacificus]